MYEMSGICFKIIHCGNRVGGDKNKIKIGYELRFIEAGYTHRDVYIFITACSSVYISNIYILP